MGDLEPWMDEAFIRELWQNLGETVTVKMIRDKFTGSNAGLVSQLRRRLVSTVLTCPLLPNLFSLLYFDSYSFVEFSSQAGCQMALNQNGNQIPGTSRVFKLNWASGGGLNDRRYVSLARILDRLPLLGLCQPG
jgi:hypothetical protein